MYIATADGRTLGTGGLDRVTAYVADAVTRLLARDPDGAAGDVAVIHQAVTSGAAAEAVERFGSWRADVTVGGKVVTLRIARVTMTT